MAASRKGPLFALAAVAFALVPFAFGLLRAMTTGDDVRYLWLALAALLGSMAVTGFGRRISGIQGVSPGRAIAAVAAGAVCATAAAVLLGATAGPAVAIVAVAFGLCTGASAVLTSLARGSRAH